MIRGLDLTKQWRRLAGSGLGVALFIQAGCCDPLDDGVSFCSDWPPTVTCPQSVTLYALFSGTYTAVDADVLTDTCNSGLTATQLRDAKVRATNDTDARVVTLTDADGHELGHGQIRCNLGVLSTQELALKSGMCSYSAQRVSQVSVTSDGVMVVKVTETRSAATGTCGAMPASCEVSYQVALQR